MKAKTIDHKNKANPVSKVRDFILCKVIGWHRFEASLEDYIEEFGGIPTDGRIASKATCEKCGTRYRK